VFALIGDRFGSTAGGFVLYILFLGMIMALTGAGAARLIGPPELRGLLGGPRESKADRIP
jgi:hypothetical protein